MLGKRFHRLNKVSRSRELYHHGLKLRKVRVLNDVGPDKSAVRLLNDVNTVFGKLRGKRFSRTRIGNKKTRRDAATIKNSVRHVLCSRLLRLAAARFE